MVKRDLFLQKYYLKDYRNNLLELDKAQATIDLYTDNVIQFIEWIEGNEERFSEKDITAIDIRDYRSYLQNIKNEKIGTINLKITSLKSYFSFLYGSKLINKNPAESIKKLKSATLPEVKSFDDKIFRSIRREVYRSQNPLFIAIWEILSRTGCRCSELCNLKLNSIIITERTAGITFVGKGNKTRELKLHTEAKNAIVEYLKIRNKIITKNDFMFLSERRCQFSRSAIWKIITKLSARAGYHITVHQIRHYVLRNLLKNGADIATVAAIAGHSSSLVTAKIYTLASKEDQDKAIDSLE
jgi:integrase/recombinase XerC